MQRTWEDVMREFLKRGQESTVVRKKREFQSKPFRLLAKRKLVETSGEDLFAVLELGKASTNHFLRCLQNLAVGLGWLPLPVIPPKLWPRVTAKQKRGITQDEHEKIISAEKNEERRHFYMALFEIGASQTDTALLTAKNIDWASKTLKYQRKKTGVWACLRIGPKLEALLKKLPAEGPLFPHVIHTTNNERAAEFYRRCKLLQIEGVTLHSYRYAWAERAKVAGYPERFAQNALGHNSRAVHAAYARGRIAVCPSLEEFEAQESAPAEHGESRI